RFKEAGSLIRLLLPCLAGTATTRFLGVSNQRSVDFDTVMLAYHGIQRLEFAVYTDAPDGDINLRRLSDDATAFNRLLYRGAACHRAIKQPLLFYSGIAHLYRHVR